MGKTTNSKYPGWRLFVRSFITLILMTLCGGLFYQFFQGSIDPEVRDPFMILLAAVIGYTGQSISFWFKDDKDESKMDEPQQQVE